MRNDNNGVAPIKAEGKLHSDPTQKANLLNRQFQSVFVKEDHKIPVPKLGDTTAPTIGDLKITPKGVEKQLSTPNINKASVDSERICFCSCSSLHSIIANWKFTGRLALCQR